MKLGRTTGRVGRPDAQETEALNEHLLTTATKLFIEHGYAGTSIEKVAGVAGAGKQTIYRRYQSKEDLFVAVVSTASQVLANAGLESRQRKEDPLISLRDTCRRLFDTINEPDAISVYRILIAEGLRFPNLVERVYQAALEPIYASIQCLLQSAREVGGIRTDIPIDDMQRLLLGMITGWSMQQMLLSRKAFATDRERRDYFSKAWALFLEGVLPPDASKSKLK
jgi:AcrR family transcriptional regulator